MLPALLSELGYEKKLRERGYLLPNEVGRLRQKIREQLGEILQEIDELTRQILALGGVDSVSEVTHGS